MAGRISNCLVGSLNVLTLIASVALMVLSFFFRSTDCQNLFRVPVLILGGCLCIVSLLGLFGSLCRVTLFSYIYQFILCASILGLIAFTVFSLVVTNKTAGDAVSGLGYKHHRLSDYSDWFQKKVSDVENWEKIKSCVIDARICQGHVSAGFSSIRSGCCKAPANCNSSTAPDPDCNIWSNDQRGLCYDCESCKLGFLGSVRSHWRSLVFIDVGALALLILVFCFGCCALQNNARKEERCPATGNPVKDNLPVHRE